MTGNAWTNPSTSKKYNLDHLDNLIVNYSIRLKGQDEPKVIPVKVFFSHHCYTRSKKEGDQQCLEFCVEKRSGGALDTRVFSPTRWEFSLKLPDIIKSLAEKSCLIGSNGEMLYRQEEADPQDSFKGWYICIRLSYKSSDPNPFKMRIRSAHSRPNRPNNIKRLPPKRFKQILREYVGKKTKA
jgi:hypothetical protein